MNKIIKFFKRIFGVSEPIKPIEVVEQKPKKKRYYNNKKKTTTSGNTTEPKKRSNGSRGNGKEPYSTQVKPKDLK
jgi:hypothetical protein